MSVTGQVRVRAFVSRGIGRDNLPDSAWEVLVAMGHLEDYLEGRITEEKLIEYARALTFYGDLIEHAEAPAEPEEKGREQEPPKLGRYEEQRAMTLAEYLELRVAAYPPVLEWRQVCWGTTRPVSIEQAHDLVEDAEVRNILSGFQEVQEDEDEPSGYLEYFARRPAEGVRRIAYYKGSRLERLRDLSERLRSELFPLWSQSEAAWVILTGRVWEVPRCLTGKIEGLSNQHLTYGTITLKVEPWVTADTVLRIYQHLQFLLLRRRPRAISDRNLTMTRFVMRQLHYMLADNLEGDEEPTKISWRRLMGLWNQKNPEWAYLDERQFYRDCRRIIRAVARPYDASSLSNENSVLLPALSIPEEDTRKMFEGL